MTVGVKPGELFGARRSSCAYVWGFNGTGGLGLGSAAAVGGPSPARLPPKTVSVAVGLDFALAVTSDGGLWAWGGNEYGQLGDGTTASRLHPQRVELPRGVHVVSAAAAKYHSVVVTSKGKVYAWGRNHFGQLGDGTTKDRYTPVRVAVHGHVRAVTAGTDHSAAVNAAGACFAWGINNAGQLGDGTTTTRLAPTRVHVPHGIRLTALDAGNDHTMALTRDGRVAVWGNPIVSTASSNPALRSTDPATVPVVLQPRLFGGSRVVAIDGGDHHATALTRDGRLWAWGRNAHGQLGDGTGTDRRVPALVNMPGRVRSVRTAGNMLLALLANGDVYAWGENRFGQLGDGTTKTRGTPGRIDGLHGSEVTTIACGPHVGVALVRRGPVSRLLLHPAHVTVKPKQRVLYRVTGADAFGNEFIGFWAQVKLRVAGGHSNGIIAWSDTPGRHVVTATSGHLSGRAVLDVGPAKHPQSVHPDKQASRIRKPPARKSSTRSPR